MDTSVFLVKRQEIQRRMELRRLEAAEAPLSSQAGRFLPWLMSTGMSLLGGRGASKQSGGWAGSLIWAVLLPAATRLLKRNNESFVQKLLHRIFPARR